MKVRDWENHPAYSLMRNIDPTIFVQSEIMTDQEKENHPKHETIGGYLKTIPLKEAWANFWHNLKEKDKQHFTTLENFDAVVFEEITGVKI